MVTSDADGHRKEKKSILHSRKVEALDTKYGRYKNGIIKYQKVKMIVDVP